MLCREPHDPAEALRAQARRTAAYMMKARARDYARRPMRWKFYIRDLPPPDPAGSHRRRRASVAKANSKTRGAGSASVAKSVR